MLKYEIIENGAASVHFCSPDGLQGDITLCGQDIAGDKYLGWDAAETTDNKVDCKFCISIVEHCKVIKRSEYTKIKP